ncbi:unnamed protein product [Prorocentrum cordatum]|uniref:Magnesium transporter n=1 Tax=Prorocentrum cordatum TaxID=2364126 RepID=A0ABN9Q1R6_9DINO|nr:unnamed protein product [Polarella glacialis]
MQSAPERSQGVPERSGAAAALDTPSRADSRRRDFLPAWLPRDLDLFPGDQLFISTRVLVVPWPAEGPQRPKTVQSPSRRDLFLLAARGCQGTSELPDLSRPDSVPVLARSPVGRARPEALLCELPPSVAEDVGLALEQWGRLRQRVKALEPTLRREGALVQEILDTGLRDENRRTLRKLTQSSAGGDVEETIQQVGNAIGTNRERLERILERNHGELVRLSTTAVSDMKEDVLREVDEAYLGECERKETLLALTLSLYGLRSMFFSLAS